jgi:predicted TIM-barrel fold metal-dependent hydrolase
METRLKESTDAARPDSTIVGDAPWVDCHAHVYTLSMPLAAGAWHKPEHEAPVEEFIATLDTHGVDRAVLAAASIHGTFNDYAIDACRRYPRLRTTVIIEPDTHWPALQQMARDGVVGVRLQWRNRQDIPDLRSAGCKRLLGRIADLDWHVQLHDDSARLPAHLDALEAAGVKIVVDHFGRPDPVRGIDCPGFQRLLRSVETGRTWVKLSAGFRLASSELAGQCARELLKHAGPRRLLWGSDWPFAAFESTTRYGDALDSLARLVPDPAARRQIGSQTPLELYFS